MAELQTVSAACGLVRTTWSAVVLCKDVIHAQRDARLLWDRSKTLFQLTQLLDDLIHRRRKRKSSVAEPLDASVILVIESAVKNCNNVLVEMVRKSFNLAAEDDIGIVRRIGSSMSFTLSATTIARLESQLQSAVGSMQLAIAMVNSLDGTRMFEILDRIEGLLRKSSTPGEESSTSTLPELATSHVPHHTRHDSGIEIIKDETHPGGSRSVIADSPNSSDLSSKSLQLRGAKDPVHFGQSPTSSHIQDFEDELRAIIDGLDKVEEPSLYNMRNKDTHLVLNTLRHCRSLDLADPDRETTTQQYVEISDDSVQLNHRIQGCSSSEYDVLLDNARDVDERDIEGVTALMRAASCKCGNRCFPCFGPLKMLISRGADLDIAVRGETALHLSVKTKNLEAARLLIGSGADVDASSPQSPLSLAVRHNQPAMVEALIRAGANPNVVDDQNWSLVHHAVDRNRQGALVALIEATQATGGNVDIDSRCEMDWTPLMHLAENRPENIECAELLLRYGADVNATDVSGYSALWYAIQGAPTSKRVRYVQLLLDRGADVEFVKRRAPRRMCAFPSIGQRGAAVNERSM